MTEADRIAALEAEVHQLRRAMGFSMKAAEVAELQARHGMSLNMGLVLLALHQAYPRVLATAHLLQVLEHHDHAQDHKANNVAVYVHGIRARLGLGAIETLPRLGYRLSADVHQLVERDLAGLPWRTAA